jgi:hypothetical protein
MTWDELRLKAELLTHEADAILALGRYAYRGGDVWALLDSINDPFTRPVSPFEEAIGEWAKEHYRPSVDNRFSKRR